MVDVSTPSGVYCGVAVTADNDGVVQGVGRDVLLARLQVVFKVSGLSLSLRFSFGKMMKRLG